MMALLSAMTMTVFTVNYHYERNAYYDARSKIHHAFAIFSDELYHLREQMRQDIELIAADEAIVNGMNMLSRYHTLEAQQPEVFSSEKRKIAEYIGHHIRFAKHDDFRIYDYQKRLVAFYVVRKGVGYTGYVTYRDNLPLYHVSTDFIHWNTHTTFDIEYRQKTYQENFYFHNHPRSLHFQHDRKITRSYPDGTNQIVGFIAIERQFDQEIVRKESAYLETQFALYRNHEALLGNITINPVSLLDIPSFGVVPLQRQKEEDLTREVFENQNYYYDGKRIDTIDGTPVYFVFGYPKSILNAELNDTRTLLGWIFLGIVLITFGISYYLINGLVLTPLNRLSEGIARIGAGDYSMPMHLRNSDELGEIARTLQTMQQRVANRESELSQSRSRLLEAQRLSHMGNWEYNRETHHFFGSAPFFEILHYREDEHLSLYRFMRWVDVNYRPLVLEHLRLAFYHGHAISIDIALQLPQCETRYINLRTRKSHQNHFSGTIQDITPLKKVQLELENYKNHLEDLVDKEIAKRREQERMLIQQNKLASMGEMMGNIAHQWRQPLNAVAVDIQDLQETYESDMLDDAYVKEIVSDIMLQVRQLSSTIDDFRNFFMPDKEKEHFNLLNAVTQALKVIQSALNEANIDVDMVIDEDFDLYGFPNEFSQVVLNILGNAKDAIERTEAKNRMIHIRAELKSGGRTMLSITDHGGGIDTRIIEKVFEPYFTTKHKSQGTGIGLYMSKTIIEKNMGGELSVHNTSDGAQFTICL